ncbi:DUF3829 domain-containing protein [Mucilaginibacter lappiensis]|uniref:DUF3829 domain-containing protein n=1 Tax=Mucilaginibacter lappiensis TaxID=354630 RepID=A0A841JNI5_9SPHI|nr:DUF3829 domain-containing protein [Mucilaginibacter lappiensis]MBB6129471.1 hypothetical protein [Mucilaginibacter lappiensis]
MKKTARLLIFPAFIVTTFIISCQNRDKGSKAKTPYAESNGDDANSIIKYNNGLLALDDSRDHYLKSLGSNIRNMRKIFDDPKAPIPYMGIGPYEMPYIPRLGENPSNPPGALNSSDKKFFKDNVAQLNALYAQIKGVYKTMSDYVKAQDYKDDNGAKGKALIDSIDNLGNKYYKLDDQIRAKLSLIADDAECVILKDHPLKEYIYSMKDDRTKVAEINTLLDSCANNYKASEARAQAAFQALKAENEKHTAMTLPGGEQYASQKNNFGRFNEAVNDFLLELKRIMRDASSSGKITDDNLKSLDSKKETIRTYYNNFVD